MNSRSAAGRRTQGALVAVLVALAAIVLAMAVDRFGFRGLALVPAGVGGLVVLAQPVWGLFAVVATIPVENVLLVSESATVTKLLGVGVAGAWFLRRLVRHEEWRELFTGGYALAGLVFVAFALASILWADFPVSINRIARLIMLLALGVLLIDLVRSWGDIIWLARILVLAAMVAAALTVIQYQMGGVHRAGAGIAGGINATAILLMSVIPFGFALARGSDGLAWRLVGYLYIPLAVVAVAVTFSRLSLLLLPVVLGVELWSVARSGHGRLPFAVMALVATVVGFQFVPLDRVMERLDSIGPYIESTLGGGSYAQRQAVSADRGYHLMVAVEIFKDHPVIGAGYQNYGRHFLQYQHSVSGSSNLYTSPRSPHSSFFGVAAELGAVGLILFGAFLFVCLRNVYRARSALADSGAYLPYLVSRAVLLSSLIQMAYCFYAEMHEEKLFWLTLALATAAWKLAPVREEAEVAGERAVAPRRTVAGVLEPVA